MNKEDGMNFGKDWINRAGKSAYDRGGGDDSDSSDSYFAESKIAVLREVLEKCRGGSWGRRRRGRKREQGADK